MTGPPDDPGAIGAEICISVLASSLRKPLTIPLDTVAANPSGLPIATTGSPIPGASCATVSMGSPSSIWSTARSFTESQPRSPCTSSGSPSTRNAWIFAAPATTCRFVTTRCGLPTANPEGRLGEAISAGVSGPAERPTVATAARFGRGPVGLALMFATAS
jgi:hypothetical protein